MHISANMAITADGKISTRSLNPARFTSQRDSQRLLKLRANKDALLVGRGTLLADTMSMTVPMQSIQPLRCIISRTSEIPKEHPVLTAKGGDIHLCTTEGSPAAIPNKVTHHNKSLPDFLLCLEKEYAVQSLHTEGGGQLIKELFRLDLIDDLYLTLAGHTLFGGRSAPSLCGLPGEFLPMSRSFRLLDFTPTEDGECFLHYSRHD